MSMEETQAVKQRRQVGAFNRKLGANIARYQKRAGLNDFELAGACQTRDSEIRAWKEGTYGPSPWRFRLMANALGVSLDELIPN